MEESTSHLLQEILTELRRQNNSGAPVREIMSISQAAEYLDISEYTLREWARMRKIPHMKVNGSIRFRKSKLDRWMDRQEIGVIQ
jgi:excisionase family DNA binding protein